MKVRPCANRWVSETWSALYVEFPTSSQGSEMPLYCGNGFTAWAMVPVKFGKGMEMFGNRACACASVVELSVDPRSDPSGRYCSGIWLVKGPATAAPGSQWPALALYATLKTRFLVNEC